MGSVLPDFDAPSHKVLSPACLAHVVLRTNNFEPMVKFYVDFLGAHVNFRNDRIAFLTYDEEHHRIALISMPEIAPKVLASSGLEHVAFTFASLPELCLSYRQRKARGVLPFWCVNHGPTTSFYYRDPDGNMLETQVDNFETAAEANGFMLSPKFAKNPVGVAIDPEDLIRRLRAGESQESLIHRDETAEMAIPPHAKHIFT